jgi:ubiquinone/menaquinone biosynthesis C-methylase UbiE
MQLKTNSEWLEWGRRDPLFGVANWKTKEIGGVAPWTDEEFYALGASDWLDFERHWKQYGYTPGTFLEIGCGAGRITKQLASAFRDGYALDVSKDMINYASKHLQTGNVEFHQTEGLVIPLADRTVDAAFSCHVLQHLPSEQAGYAYFREVFRVLKPGGSLMIHLPIHCFPTAVSLKFASFCDFLYRRLRFVTSVRSSYQRFRMKHGSAPPMHGTSYEQASLQRALHEMGYVQIEFCTFAVASNGFPHSFVMAAKSRTSHV